MPPLSEIVWDIADTPGDAAILAQSAPAGPGVLLCSFAIVPGPLALVAATIPPTTTEDLHGYVAASAIGSLTPDTYNGQIIGVIQSGLDRFGSDNSLIRFNATGLGQSFFTSLEINGVTHTSATATFTDDGTNCQWSWSGLDGYAAWFFVDGSYTATFA